MHGTSQWQEARAFLLECQSRAGLKTGVLDDDTALGGHKVLEFTRDEFAESGDRS